MRFRAILLTTLALGALAAAPAAVEAQTGSISGVVTNDVGETLMGVIVRADDGSTSWGFGNADFTDMAGAYAIDDLAPGTYEVTAQRFGYVSMTAMVDVVDGQNTVADFVLSAPTFGTVAGVVTDAATTTALEGARVRVLSSGGFFGGFFGQGTMTDATGAYSIDDVRTGDRDLSVRKNDYVSQTLLVTVTDGVTTTADVALDPLAFGTLSGVVTDGATGAPIEGAFVLTRGGGNGFFGGLRFAMTDATGAYSLTDVPTGDRDVRVFAQGFFSETQTVTVTDGANSVADFALGGLTFGTITGTVTDAATGLAIEGAWVRVRTAGWVQTDRLGNYTVDDVRTGTRNVRVFAQGYVNASAMVDVTDGSTTTTDFMLDLR